MTSLTPDRQEAVEELHAIVRRFVADHDGVGQARRMLDGGEYDEATWSTMAEQLGLPGLTFAEEYDGAGAGWPEATAVLYELGRAVLPSAYLATTVLAGTAIAHSKDDALQRELLPVLARGERTAALAVLEGSGSWDLGRIGLTATSDGDGYRLDGTKLFVVDGHLADLVVVAGRSELGLSLFVVDGGSAGLTRTPMPTLDPTRPLARLEFTGVSARLLGVDVGGADRCMEMTMGYVRDRVAFGRPIGGFQAVKHKLVDLYLEIEFARAAVEAAAAAAESEPDMFPVYASVALAQAMETFALVATETIHLHGGIGFTWEHDAQLFFRRAKSSQLMFGDATFHRERIAGRLLDDRTHL
jgi:alkylation response protein AidB-like acyl-CoA dehydrogenase